jgi:hypothetical protein
MEIQFREFDQFSLWIWVEFANVPSMGEKQALEELFDSWFYLGKLGGFNAENIQVQEAGSDLSYFDYDREIADNTTTAFMHNMGEFEYEGCWARCWFDLGTSDSIALDVLIQSCTQLGRDYLSLEKLVIGGENPDWPIDDRYRLEQLS